MESNTQTHVLLLTPRQAAKALNVCERTLWTLTKRGQVPAVRIGWSVRYNPADLRCWIESMESHKQPS
jgi:excisionase family DNA binding protein